MPSFLQRLKPLVDKLSKLSPSKLRERFRAKRRPHTLVQPPQPQISQKKSQQIEDLKKVSSNLTGQGTKRLLDKFIQQFETNNCPPFKDIEPFFHKIHLLQIKEKSLAAAQKSGVNTALASQEELTPLYVDVIREVYQQTGLELNKPLRLQHETMPVDDNYQNFSALTQPQDNYAQFSKVTEDNPDYQTDDAKTGSFLDQVQTPPKPVRDESYELSEDDEWDHAAQLVAEKIERKKAKDPNFDPSKASFKVSHNKHNSAQDPLAIKHSFVFAGGKLLKVERARIMSSGGFSKVKLLTDRQGNQYIEKQQKHDKANPGKFKVVQGEVELAKTMGQHHGDFVRERKSKGEGQQIHYSIQPHLGKSLDHVMLEQTVQGSMPSLEQRQLFAQLAILAVQQLHAHNIIHMDLHAGNFMVKPTENGLVMNAIDFGLSCVREPGTGVRKEDPDFSGIFNKKICPPEFKTLVSGQWVEGSTGMYDRSSDIYQLGYMLKYQFGLGSPVIDQMLDPNPMNRPSLDTVLQSVSVMKIEGDVVPHVGHVIVPQKPLPMEPLNAPLYNTQENQVEQPEEGPIPYNNQDDLDSSDMKNNEVPVYNNESKEEDEPFYQTDPQPTEQMEPLYNTQLPKTTSSDKEQKLGHSERPRSIRLFSFEKTLEDFRSREQKNNTTSDQKPINPDRTSTKRKPQ